MQTLSQANPIESYSALRFYTSKQQLHLIKLKKQAPPDTIPILILIIIQLALIKKEPANAGSFQSNQYD